MYGGGTPDEGSFSEGGLHAVSGRDYTESSVFRFSKRSATCGDNSIVHFIRSVALRYKHAYPLSWVSHSAGMKGDRDGGAEGDSI